MSYIDDFFKRSDTKIATGIACVALFLGSFGDEATQVMFALRFSETGQTAPAQVSALLAAGLLGGISAGFFSPRLLAFFGARRVINIVFIAEATLIAVASFMNTLFWCLIVSAALGCLGSILWSAVMVALPALFTDEAGIDRANRVIQSVRNLGYVVGPLIGSIFFALSPGPQGFLSVAILMLISVACTAISLPKLLGVGVGKENSYGDGKSVDILGLLRTEGVSRAITPLLITVLVTSVLNVLLLVRIRNELGINAEIYGVIVATLSAGLVAGPVIFSSFVGKKIGEASGASIAAAVIGLSIVIVGSTQLTWQIVVAAAFIGVANGVQNSLMSGFIIKRVDSTKRVLQMPAYVLLLQTAVFIGFIGSAFIHVDQAGLALVIVGFIATFVGLFGAFVNRSNKQQLSKKKRGC
ncbi:MFS transporter [Rothia sp. P6271]|uniref:MFS transporter n=1 Tax=Rothia sp. P6271 TaxID=3402659 RepID=UPI003AC199CB